MTLRMRCVKVVLGGEDRANPIYTSEFQDADGRQFGLFLLKTRKPTYTIGQVYKLELNDEPESDNVIRLQKEEVATP